MCIIDRKYTLHFAPGIQNVFLVEVYSLYRQKYGLFYYHLGPHLSFLSIGVTPPLLKNSVFLVISLKSPTMKH